MDELVIPIVKVVYVTHINVKNKTKNFSMTFLFYMSAKSGQVVPFCVYNAMSHTNKYTSKARDFNSFLYIIFVIEAHFSSRK